MTFHKMFSDKPLQNNPFKWWYAFVGYSAFLLALVLNSLLMSTVADFFKPAGFSLGNLFNVLMFVLAGTICLFALRLISHRQLTRDAFGIHLNSIFVVITVGSILGLLFFGLSEFIESHDRTLKDAGEQVMQAFNLGHSLTNDLLLVLGIGLFAPVVEEIIFRGAIFNSIIQGLKHHANVPRWLGLVIGLAVSTFAFISIHGGGGQDTQLALLAVLSILAALAMYVTRSLFAAIFVHAVNNNVVFIYTVSQQSYLQETHSTTLIIASMFCLLLCLPLGLIFGRLLPNH